MLFFTIIKVNFYNYVNLLKLKRFNENREMDVPILHTWYVIYD